MKKYLWMIMVALGVALVVYSILIRESTLYIALIFPVVVISGVYGLIGTALIFFGIISAIATFFSGYQVLFDEPPDTSATPSQKVSSPPAPPSKKGQKKGSRPSAGGILFLGPLPIVFGSDAKVTRVMLILAIILFIIVILGFVLFLGLI
jgi:uncharacterized protein (TIGR00304 family)